MIDWKLIESCEGGVFLVGYVPTEDGEPLGHSGVTVADGVDLGQQSAAYLAAIGVSAPLVEILRPYLGARGTAAQEMLEKRPLLLTASQAYALSAVMHVAHEQQLQRAYDKAIPAGAPTFEEIPSEVATVICSVSYQYGDLARECPNFWHCSITADWAGLLHELENFGDKYPTRRYKEAEYLRGLMLV